MSGQLTNCLLWKPRLHFSSISHTIGAVPLRQNVGQHHRTMKCWHCENEAKAICVFCGCGICAKHRKAKAHFAGYGLKTRPVLEGIIPGIDRKSTRLNSSHLVISYAVFCL